MKICVASSSSVQDKSYMSLASSYIENIMDLDIELVCGGVSSSMMRKVYEVFTSHKKKVTCYTLFCYDEEKICENTILLDQPLIEQRNYMKNQILFVYYLVVVGV